MKKIVLVSLVFLAVLTPGTAQNFNYSSLALDFSANLFPSPMDQALNAADLGYGPAFGELDHNYLFGGIANLNTDTAVSSGGAPAIIGFYREGDMPWSFVSSKDFTGISEASGNTTPAYGAAVTNGGVTYPVLNSISVVDNMTRLFATLTTQFQYLTVFGDLVSGLYFSLHMTNNASAAANSTTTQTFYYDSSTTPGTTVPVNSQDYRTTTTISDKAASVLDFTVAAPFYLRGGSLSHSGNLSFASRTVDNGTTNTETLTPISTNALASATYNTNTTVDKTSRMTIDLDYGLMMESFLSNHKESRFKANANAELIFYGGKSSISNVNQDYSITAGVLSTNETRAEVLTTDTITSNMGFDINLGASEQIYHDFGDMITMGLMPTLFMGFDRAHTVGNITQRVVVDKADGNGDNLFDNVADTITTTTTTYTNTGSNMAALVSSDTITFRFSLPTALKFHPEGWICGFVFSNTPTITFAGTTTTTKTSVNTQTVATIQGDGSGATTATTNPESSVVTSTKNNSWNVDNTATLGAEFYLPGDIILMVQINGNLLAPESFTIQAVAPTDFMFN